MTAADLVWCYGAHLHHGDRLAVGASLALDQALAEQGIPVQHDLTVRQVLVNRDGVLVLTAGPDGRSLRLKAQALYPLHRPDLAAARAEGWQAGYDLAVSRQQRKIRG